MSDVVWNPRYALAVEEHLRRMIGLNDYAAQVNAARRAAAHDPLLRRTVG